MNISYLLIGGNEGDREDNLARTRTRIEEAGCIILLQSSIYETAAWGRTDQPPFLNQALKISTPLNASALLDLLLRIETDMGRIRLERYGSRMIDIDILFFNDAVLDLPSLTIPHPRIPDRRFALAPLQEIAPDYIHPVLHRSITDLLRTCPDPLEVQLLTKL